jgi:hypothetical protein
MELESGADRLPPKVSGGEVAGGLVLLLLSLGVLAGAALAERSGNDSARGRPRAQLTAAISESPSE